LPVAPALASRGHTFALVAVILAVAVTGTWLQHSGVSQAAAAARARAPTSAERILTQYLPLLLVNAGLVLYVARLFRGRNVLPELMGRPVRGPRDALTDALHAVLAFFLILTLEALMRPWFAGRNAALSSLLPSTEAERLSWLLVASSIGFCEEVVYRGYLQTQLSAFARSPALGVLLQALLFALAHLEQGLSAAARIGGYGLILGVLARERGRLLPGILCHVAMDLASGLLR
jgi:membrane protease YdiL (CAAX protease family)